MSERHVDVHHFHHALGPHTNRTPFGSLKFWKVPLLRPSEEEGGEVSPGVNLFPLTYWVESTFNEISSLQVTLMKLPCLTCVSGTTLPVQTLRFTPRGGLHPHTGEPSHGMSAPT